MVQTLAGEKGLYTTTYKLTVMFIAQHLPVTLESLLGTQNRRPTPDLMNPSLSFNKIPRGDMFTLCLWSTATADV